MPKLLVFAPCDRVIVDKFSNIPSIIGVLQNIGMFVKAGAEIQGDIVVPRSWAVFTLWRPSQEDIGKKLRQITQIVLPDGKVFLSQNQEFVMEEKPHYNIVSWIIFPMGQQGEHPITMWLENLEGTAVTEKYIHPLYVHHAWLPADAVPSEKEEQGSPNRK
jgi:hypothetical protein